MNGKLASLPLGETRICDECGERSVRGSFREQQFIYGDGTDAVELSARIIFWACAHCGHAYTDGDAEDSRHEAVCRHLGVLSPKEIREIRETQGMSQADFAKVTGFGLASVKRWETGALIQNQAADRLLRLIEGDASIMARLVAMRNRALTRVSKSSFRTDFSDEIRKAAEVFVLRPTDT
jgi:putative zinc finger/helix-turn-helix YgiT family protein